MAFLCFGVPARPISHFEKGGLKQLNAKKDLNRREKPPKVYFGGGLENGRFALSLGRTESLPRQHRPQNPTGRCLFNSICMLGLQGNPLLGSWYIGFKSPKIVPDQPKLSQVWKPAPTTHKQDLSTHQSISSTAVLASLVEASPGNLKKTMMGAARRQQHVFRRLGNQICDSPPHHTQSHRAKTA